MDLYASFTDTFPDMHECQHHSSARQPLRHAQRLWHRRSAQLQTLCAGHQHVARPAHPPANQMTAQQPGSQWLDSRDPSVWIQWKPPWNMWHRLTGLGQIVLLQSPRQLTPLWVQRLTKLIKLRNQRIETRTVYLKITHYWFVLTFAFVLYRSNMSSSGCILCCSWGRLEGQSFCLEDQSFVWSVSPLSGGSALCLEGQPFVSRVSPLSGGSALCLEGQPCV